MTSNKKQAGTSVVLPRGYARLNGALDYDAWVYTCKAQWARAGTLYALNVEDPRKTTVVKMVPLPALEVEWKRADYKSKEDLRVTMHNEAAKEKATAEQRALREGELIVANYDACPDYSAETRPETAGEKRERITAYE